MSRKPKTKKPQELMVDFGVDNGSDVVFKILPNNSGIAYKVLRNGEKTNVADTKTAIFYKRGRNPKYINVMATPGNDLGFDINYALSRFDVIIAIDTATKQHREEDISVTSIVLAGVTEEQNKLKMIYNAKYYIEFRGVKLEAELLGYKHALNLVMRSSSFSKDLKIAVIVDNLINDILDINSRKKPFVDDMFLPEEFTMFYATSDTGRDDYIANKLISIADKRGKDLLDLIIRNYEYVESHKVEATLREPIRLWKLSNQKET